MIQSGGFLSHHKDNHSFIPQRFKYLECTTLCVRHWEFWEAGPQKKGSYCSQKYINFIIFKCNAMFIVKVHIKFYQNAKGNS